jgi:hypothetical protein
MEKEAYNPYFQPGYECLNERFDLSRSNTKLKISNNNKMASHISD